MRYSPQRVPIGAGCSDPGMRNMMERPANRRNAENAGDFALLAAITPGPELAFLWANSA